MKNLFGLIFSVTSIICSAQVKLKPTIGIGPAFRFTEWVLESKPSTTNYYGFIYKYQDSKTRVNIDLRQKLFKSRPYFAELSSYFAYTEFKKVGYRVDKTLKRDHYLDILRFFKSKPGKAEFIAGLGVGFMNCGTKFRYQKIGLDNSGNWAVLDENAQGTMRFIAPRIMFGIQKMPFDAFVIFHGTPDGEGDPFPTIWMEIKGTVNFNLF